MSDKMRWRYGETNPVIAAVDSGTVIEIGDLLYQDTDDAKPADQQADKGNETANQEYFADRFLGVAMQRSLAGETAPIRVATTGVFEYDCPSGTHELGATMGVDEAGNGTELMNQQLAAVTAACRAIGKIARREAATVTTCLVDIRSTVMLGGIEGGSYSA